MNTTTITVDIRVKKQLDHLKKHMRESYNDVLRRMLTRRFIAKHSADREALEETTAILSNPEIMKSLARSLEDLKKGRLHPLESV